MNFTGLSSVADRTIFTNRGPIVKSPVPILTGVNLSIVSPDEVVIPTGNFNSTFLGKTISISGSPGGRNDGTFYISAVKGPTRLRLKDASFEYANLAEIETQLVSLVNNLKDKYNLHRVYTKSHETADTVNAVTAQDAVDTASACIVLNQLKTMLFNHSNTAGTVHSFVDPDATTYFADATSLESAVLLSDELRKRFEQHRQDRFFHLEDDFKNHLTVNFVNRVVGSGIYIGPFTWTIFDPRNGQIADDPSDVSVLVNSMPASVEAVFGILGAVVLTTKPNPTDSVLIDYRYITNPPLQFERLNSFEFLLNQEGNHGISGVPNHRYRQRSYLINTKDPNKAFKSPYQPLAIGWKYKAYERKYTACLNDPNSLLLNVPNNRIMYPVLVDSVFEEVVRYDPVTLPQNSTDPWVNSGIGIVTTNGKLLKIVDSGTSASTAEGPPFFSHKINTVFPSEISAAYRFYAEDPNNLDIMDGCFVGVGFGISDGNKASVVGFIKTDANNLTSAIAMANDVKAKFGSHLVAVGIHQPSDTVNQIDVVDATDLPSLIILVNRIKKFYNDHLALGPNNVHLNVDTVNTVTLADATNLLQSIDLINAIRSAFNSHRISSTIHYFNDVVNDVDLVKQVGILTNLGFQEEQKSWEAFAFDWTIETTYRLYRDSIGNVSLYLSGDISARIIVLKSSLPEASSLDIKLDQFHQTFFGAIGDESSSISYWKFARVDINPINSNQIVGNKSVEYVPNYVPELDPTSPWISVGQGGTEEVVRSVLRIDSTSFVPKVVSEESGELTGEFKGFVRIEPSLTVRNTLSFEFKLSSQFYSFGIDNKSLGVFFGDGTFSTSLNFLQSDPIPATITGSIREPFPIVANDTAIISIDGGSAILITSSATITTAAGICSLINSIVGFTLATPYPGVIPNVVKLTNASVGASSSINIIGGNIFEKLGIAKSVYFGSDTSPEPKLSWFGENTPDKGTPTWSASGSQSAQMFERTMRLTDNSDTDFRSYTINDPTITSLPIPSNYDWKADFRVNVLSYAPGSSVISGPNFRFCGTLVSIDEGPSGVNVEIHLSTDLGGSPYVVIYTYNSATNSLDYVNSYPFTWNDGKAHSFSIYTSKGADLGIVLGDGSSIGIFSMSNLQVGVYGPSMTFGSGSGSLDNCDLSSAKSVVDWTSVCCVRDKKLSDPTSSTRKYIGLYRGGDPSVLSSYYLHQVDWSNPHVYRVVRDPASAVHVFLDSDPTPVISASYDALTLPLSMTNFLYGVVPSGKFVAFGSFNDFEITRSYWEYIKYSIGKMTITDGIVPSRHQLNRANVVASPEHLFTKKLHSHYGTTSYSSGTPTDDFMNNSEVPAYTILGSGTAPVPMTQNLQSRGGLISNVTPVETIPSVDLVNEKGNIASFENDDKNTVSLSSVSDTVTTENTIVADVSALITQYLSHIGSAVFHVAPDGVNNGVPIPVNFVTALSSLNLLQTKYNSHLIEAGVHYNDDVIHFSSAPAAVDIATAIILINELVDKFNYHIKSNLPHPSGSSPFTVFPDVLAALNDLKDQYNSHRVEAGVHVTDDNVNIVSLPYATDMVGAVSLANDLRTRYESHRQYPGVHSINDIINTITSPVATDFSSLVALTNDLVNKYNSHRTQVGVHVINDTVNVTGPTNETLALILEDVRSVFNRHVVDITVHLYSDQINQILDALLFKLSGSSSTIDIDKVIVLIGKLISSMSNHFMNESHLTEDYVNNLQVLAIPTPTDFTSSLFATSQLRTILTSHISNTVEAHDPIDNTNTATRTGAIDPLPAALNLSNELLRDLSGHVMRKVSHVKVGPEISHAEAVDTPTLISLSNYLKAQYEEHRVRPGTHVVDDTVNIVTAPDASDLDTSIALINDVRIAYGSHIVQTGVHANTVVVRLDPPPGVLYESMKFYTFTSGEIGHVSTFSDDETLYIKGSIQNTSTTRLTYPGNNYPDRSAVVGSKFPPFFILEDEILSISINRSSPIDVEFQVGDTTTGAVISRINGTAGIPAGLASDNGDGRIRIVETIGGPDSWLEFSGPAAEKLGLTNFQPTPWVLAATDETAVSVSLMTAGPVDFLRMGTTGTGTEAAYVVKTGLTDQSSIGFQADFNVRIQSWSYLPGGDTGIYIGVSGASGPGFTAAIGFVNEAGAKAVILKDMTSGKKLASKKFDWGDGSFHSYRIERTPIGQIRLIIIS